MEAKLEATRPLDEIGQELKAKAEIEERIKAKEAKKKGLAPAGSVNTVMPRSVVYRGSAAAAPPAAPAAAAVAAHECGHAVQHAQGYEWLQLRSSLVPVVGIASNLSMIVIIAGLVLMQVIPFGFEIAAAGVVLFGIGTLFSIVTLPVEYDASKRALAWLQRKNMVSREELAGAHDALKWAARTYVVAALGSLATLAYFAFQVFGGRRN